MIQPGTPAAKKPAGDDWISKEIADLKRQIRELGPSIAKSFNTTVATLTALVASELAAASARGNAPGGNGVTTSYQTLVSCSVAVPEGYTQAIVTAIASAQAECDAPAVDYFYVESYISVSSTGAADWESTGGFMSQSSSGTVPGAVVYPQAAVTDVKTFTGLNGGTITASLKVSSQYYAWSGSASSGGAIQLQVIFIR